MIFPQGVSGNYTLTEDIQIKRSFKFNFKTGQHVMENGTPVEITGRDAVAQWLELLVRTRLDKYEVYRDTGFGHTAEKYLGFRELPRGFIESEFKREIEEASKLNPAIASVSNFSAVRTTRGLDVYFTAHLKNGDSVEVDVTNGQL